MGGNPAVNSAANAYGVTGPITLAAGQSDTSCNAGLVGAAPAYGFTVTAGSYYYSEGVAVTTDTSGNVYVTGAFYGTVNFDAGPAFYELTSQGTYDAFVAKYSSTGALVWAKGLDGASTAIGTGIAVDSSGNVYVTGFYSGTVNFNPGPGAYDLTSAGGDDAFVVKLNSAGNFLWANSMGGSGRRQGLWHRRRFRHRRQQRLPDRLLQRHGGLRLAARPHEPGQRRRLHLQAEHFRHVLVGRRFRRRRTTTAAWRIAVDSERQRLHYGLF